MEITAHVICIGNEIMLGHINNTNARYASKNLSSIGIRTTRQISIPDDPDVIISSIKNSLRSANIVITSGGLGPTVDDVTLDSISKALNRRLVFNNKVANHIRDHFKRRGLKMPKNNLRQALVPEGAKYILNNIGTAPGLIIVRGKALDNVLVALPGVPFELYPMFKKTVIPYLKKRFNPDKIIKSRGINEDFKGRVLKVLIDEEEGNRYIARTEYDAPEVDGVVYIRGKGEVLSLSKGLSVGGFYNVRINDTYEYDLIGTA